MPENQSNPHRRRSRRNAPRSSSPLSWSAETWAFLSLRLFLGLQFLVGGLGKFGGDGGYSFSQYYDGLASWMISTFAENTHLPTFLVAPYAWTIGYLKIALGALLLLGIRTKHVLAVYALTLVSLAYGQMLLGNGDKVSQIAILLLMNIAALYFVRHNKLEALR